MAAEPPQGPAGPLLAQLPGSFSPAALDLVRNACELAVAPDDDRVIILKLLDRLHNTRTIEYLETGKQLSRSQETLELLIPHARRLGLQPVADELRELARAPDQNPRRAKRRAA